MKTDEEQATEIVDKVVVTTDEKVREAAKKILLSYPTLIRERNRAMYLVLAIMPVNLLILGIAIYFHAEISSWLTIVGERF